MRAKPTIEVKYEDGTTRSFRYRPCLDQADVESALKVSAVASKRDGARKVVGKAILEPDNNEIYAAYTLIRENLHINDPGRAT